MASLDKQKIQDLLFFVASDFEDSLIDDVAELIDKLAASREWLLGPPVFVNEELEGPDVYKGSEEDEDIYTLGGLFRLYSSYSPERLPREVDRIHFEEVQEIVRQVRRFSLEKQVDFEFELDQEHIGTIRNGEMDRSLREGLLEEWEAVLRGEREGL